MLFNAWIFKEISEILNFYLLFYLFTCLFLIILNFFTNKDLFFQKITIKITFTKFKLYTFYIVTSLCLVNIYLLYFFNSWKFNSFKYDFESADFDIGVYYLITSILKHSSFNITTLSLTKFNLSFILLFSFLYPIIFSFLTYDLNCYSSDTYLKIYIIFFLSFLILLVENIILFYFLYELLLILVFYAMFLSSNSRGSVEASLFFAGWAILGSIFVGLGFLILIIKTNSVYFCFLQFNKLTLNETYYIYILLFFGFGVKLSIWPFWYWLPKAHVEVSTGMSIFLSCILIKLSLFSLLRLQHSLLSEIPLNICIFVCLICAFDIIFRFANLQDLKAMIAYGSVLHTNLLTALIHLDSFSSIKNSIFYIWGHSLSTTTLFIVVNVIETRYSSRSILYVSGIWYTSPLLAKLTVFSLLSFLDIPLTLFFWGEIWLWEIVIFSFIWTACSIIFIVNVIFMSIFFKVWWNVLFGTPDFTIQVISYNDLNFDTNFILLWLNFSQIILGIQPNILSFLCGFYI